MPTVANTVGNELSSLAVPLATHARMKVFFVGDNRANLNWGRGASIALDQFLSSSFEIAGRVTGDFFDLVDGRSRLCRHSLATQILRALSLPAA